MILVITAVVMWCAATCWMTRRREQLIMIAFSMAVPLCATAAPLDGVTLDPATFRGTAGFFRVGQDTQKNWWFVTPDNKPMYYRGVTSINRAGTSGGRRAKDGVYATAVDANYPNRLAFAEAQVRRLREWHFNALGAWCTDEFYDLSVDGSPMPYTEILEFGYVGPQIVGPGIWLPDVFDTAWQKAADEWAAKICTPHKTRTALIGYFTDNELTWAQSRGEDLAQQADPNARKRGGQMLLLQHALSLPESSGTFKAAWSFVSERYHNDLQALSEAWGIKILSSDTVRAMNPRFTHSVVGDGSTHPDKILRAQPQAFDAKQGPPNLITSAKYFADQEAFSRLFAEQYFRRCAEAIRKTDPDHLILGCRFGGPPGKAVLQAMKKDWVDVCSANNYRENMAERMTSYHRATGLPVLNGEFAYHSGEFALREKTQEGMAKRGLGSLQKLFEEPGVIGYTWYRWVQGDGQPLSCGLVNIDDNPRQIHVQTLTAANASADEIASKRAPAEGK